MSSLFQFNKAGFNDGEKLRLLRNEIVHYPEIAQLVLFRLQKIYADLIFVIKNFVKRHAAFTSHVPIAQIPSTSASLRTMPLPPYIRKC